MKFIKLLIVASVLLSCSISNNLQAQDIHFSQFYLAPLNLNPALTGIMNCNGRFTMNYRSQWSSVMQNPFTTYSATYDARIPVGRSDFFGWGLNFVTDKAGASEFGIVQGKLSGSYSKKMGGRRKTAHYLVAGAEAGLSQQSINFFALQFGSQFDGERYDGNLPTNENFARETFLFGDVSAGLLWFTVLNENTNFYVGSAFSHLNSPNRSFFDDNIQWDSKLTVHAGGEVMLGRNWGLVPGVVLFRQGPALETNVGTSVKFLLGNRTGDYQAFQVGLWGRVARNLDNGLLSDAAIISTRFDFNNFTLGFSYDINVSELNAASNGNGGFELALVYQICNGFQRNVYCPRF